MSDKLLAHKSALEVLQKPEHFREHAKKNINVTELKKWLEASEPFEEDDEVLCIYNH